MPNWITNRVLIDATKADLDAWLIPLPSGGYAFNFDRLFPNTDSAPRVQQTMDVFGDGSAGTTLAYKTLWKPDKETLKRLHEQTGWAIDNSYASPELKLAGTYQCHNGACVNERYWL